MIAVDGQGGDVVGGGRSIYQEHLSPWNVDTHYGCQSMR